MEVFTLLGRIAINKDAALKDLRVVQQQAQKTATGMSSSFKKFGNFVQKNSAQIKAVGRQMTIMGGLASAAFGLAVKTAAGFEQSMANVQSVAGATGEELQKLSDYAREMGKTSIYSASQAADAMYYLASAGMNTNEIMGALQGTLLLAAATQSDLAFVSETVAATLSQFALEASEADRVANVFAATISGSQATMEKLSTSMSYVGPIARAVGLEIEDVTGILGNLYNAGIDGSTAGTALRMAFARLLDPTDKARAALEKLRVSITDSSGELRPFVDIIGDLEEAGMGAEEALAIFGARAGTAMVALVQKGAQSIRDMTEAVTGTDKATEMAAIQLETFQGQLTILKSAVEELMITIGNQLLPVLTSLAEDIQDTVNKITDWTKANPELTEKIVKWGAAISALMLVLGPLLMMLPGLVTAIGFVSTAVSGLGIYLGALQVQLGLTAGQFALLATEIVWAIGILNKWKNAIIDAAKTSVRMDTATHIASTEQKKFADKLGVTVEQLKQFQKEGLTVGEMAERAGTSLEELGNKAKNAFEKMSPIEQLAAKFNVTVEVMREFQKEGLTLTEMAEKTGQTLDDVAARSERLETGITDLGEGMGDAAGGADDLGAGIGDLGIDMDGMNKDIQASIDNLKKQSETMDDTLSASEKLALQLKILRAEYELTNKTEEQAAEYRKERNTLLTQYIAALEKEQQQLEKGTQAYANITLQILAAKQEMNALVEVEKEVIETQDEFLSSLERLDKDLGLLENRYEGISVDTDYFRQKIQLLTQQHKLLNEELSKTKPNTQEWYDYTNRIIDNEQAQRDLREEMEKFNEAQDKSLKGIELVNAELSLLEKTFQSTGDETEYVAQKTELLQKKYELLNKALQETDPKTKEWFELKEAIIDVEQELGNLEGAVKSSEGVWTTFFNNLRSSYGTALTNIQDGITSFTQGFESALSDAIYAMIDMKEVNAQVQQEIAENEQQWLTAREEAQEAYKQTLINQLSEYVDAKTLANDSIAELEQKLKVFSQQQYEELSQSAQENIQQIDDKYGELDENIRDKQVSMKSIWATFWESLKKAAIDALVQIIVKQAMSVLLSNPLLAIAVLGIAFIASLAMANKSSGEEEGEIEELEEVETASSGGEVENTKAPVAVRGFRDGGTADVMSFAPINARRFQSGGGTDTVPAWLTPGEYVISKPMTDFIKKTGVITSDLINAIRLGEQTPKPGFAGGGIVSDTGGGALTLNILPGAIAINAKTLDDRTISDAGTKLFAEIEKQARNAGKLVGR